MRRGRFEGRGFFAAGVLAAGLTILTTVGCAPQMPRTAGPGIAATEHQMLNAPPKVRVLLADGLKGPQSPTVKSDGKVRFEDAGGRMLKEAPDLVDAKIEVEKDKLHVGTLVFGEPIVTMRTTGTFKLGTKTYRGDLEIRRRADGTLTLVNHLDLESYTRGVVASEMPNEWPVEALKAQAVASRTYAYALVTENAGAGLFDVTGDFQTHQVYEGVMSETAPSDRAVQETRGMVLTYGRKPFRTYFCSTCGGHTEACGLVWKDYATITPLTGVTCAYCKESKWYTPWETSFSAVQIRSALEAVGHKAGEVKDLKLVDQNGDGHFDKVEVTTSNGKVEMSGNEFRLALGSTKLKSTMCKTERKGNTFAFSGRGFGHGVGMCQYGVLGMVRQGKLWEEVEHYYYPGCDIWRIYR